VVLDTAPALVTPNIYIPGPGKLDIGTRALIVAGGTDPHSKMATLKTMIIRGRNVPVGGVGDGAWTGLGIPSSAAQAAFVSEGIETRAIGYAINSDLPLGAYATFAGQSVGPDDILIRYTRTGDADL